MLHTVPADIIPAQYPPKVPKGGRVKGAG